MIVIILMLIWWQKQRVPDCVELLEFRHGPRCRPPTQGFPMLEWPAWKLPVRLNNHLYSSKTFQLCSPLFLCTRTCWHVSIQVSFTWENFSTLGTCCLSCVALHVVTQGSAVLEPLATRRTIKWTRLFTGVVPISWLTPKSGYCKITHISNTIPQ